MQFIETNMKSLKYACDYYGHLTGIPRHMYINSSLKLINN
jgi:hypothetical protein